MPGEIPRKIISPLTALNGTDILRETTPKNLQLVLYSSFKLLLRQIQAIAITQWKAEYMLLNNNEELQQNQK